MSLACRFFALAVLVAAASTCAPRHPQDGGGGAAPAAANGTLPRTHAPRPTAADITAADLMTRLYIFADDSMMGRQAGTEYNVKGTAYIAAELRKLGLTPAGDSGTYFQSIPLVRRSFVERSPLTVDGERLVLWADVAPVPRRGGAPRSIDGAQVIYGGTYGDTTVRLTREQAAGKVVLFAPGPDMTAQAAGRRLAPDSPLAEAAAVAVVGLEQLPAHLVALLRRPSLAMSASSSSAPPPAPLALAVTRRAAERLLGAPLEGARVGALGRRVRGTVALAEVSAQARNVVAVMLGSDPALRGEYVAIGAHNDHIGFNGAPVDHDSLRAYNAARRALAVSDAGQGPLTTAQRASIVVDVDSLRRLSAPRPDSINNGADDDGSGSVAVLEIAEALASAPRRPRRSVLFVWHTGEELGLLGSRYFTDSPTVPRDSIVAQINIDMIGRGAATETAGGGPDYLALVGSRRLSSELGDLVEAVNRGQRRPLALDYQFDANGHPENIYCRSDHYNYARYGIPIVFFFTGLHGDYHQVTDEPQYIDYAHMERITRFIADLTVRLGDLGHRPAVDKPRPDPHGRCQQ